MTLVNEKVRKMREIRGFTLLEALLVLAITGILVSSSIPSFRATVGRYQVSSQADSFLSMVKLARAQAALEAVAAGMERYRVSTDTYVGATASNVPIAVVYNLAADEVSTFYDFTATGLSATAYALFATPISSQSQATDGALTLTSIGVRGWDEDNAGGTYETGW